MTYPTIKTLDDILPHIQHMKNEFCVSRDAFGNTIIFYNVLPDRELWFNEQSGAFFQECRGITFDAQGNIVSRPFHKFFNYGEVECNTKKHLNDNSPLDKLLEKRDGSMVSPLYVNGKLVFKTKKSVTSEVAIFATNVLNLPENSGVVKFCKAMIAENKTPIFEFTAPGNQIVVVYTERKLVLLAVRDNFSGEYLDIQHEAKGFEVECVRDMKQKIIGDDKKWVSKLLTFTENTENRGIEGFVAITGGKRVKFKTQWYLDLHHACTFLRVRDVVRMILNETVDDAISKFQQDIDIAGEESEIGKINTLKIAEINSICRRVAIIFDEINQMIDEATENGQSLVKEGYNRGEVHAILQTQFPNFHFIKLVMGKLFQPGTVNSDMVQQNIVKHIRTHLLKTFPLDTIAAKEIEAVFSQKDTHDE